jgi:DNA-binding NarL/FixJ family response regulator
MTEARFLVADDHEVVRIGIRALLEERDGWQVIAEACDGAEALTKTNELGPDVAILDIRMPVMSGLEVARLIAKSKPKTKVLIVTSYECDQLIWESLEIGSDPMKNWISTKGLLDTAFTVAEDFKDSTHGLYKST